MTEPMAVERIAASLTPHEIQILRECAGYLPASPWGGRVGACLAALRERGLVRDFPGTITDLGRSVAAHIRASAALAATGGRDGVDAGAPDSAPTTCPR